MYCHGCESENIFLHLPPSQSQMYSWPHFWLFLLKKQKKTIKRKSHRHFSITFVFQKFVFYNPNTLNQNSGVYFVINKVNLHLLSYVYCGVAECVRRR